jgi:AcrR family transcriptional regulator
VERLIGAATRLFADQGYQRTTVQEVVAAAGVTKGAMYHYFASKEDLLYEIYRGILAVQLHRLQAFAEAEAPIEERLRAAAVDVIATTVDNFEDLTIVVRCMHLLEPEKQRAVHAERRRDHELFRGMIEEGQRTGAFDDVVDADLVVDYFFGAVHHLPTWFRPSGRLGGRELGERYASLLLKGLTAPRHQIDRETRGSTHSG